MAHVDVARLRQIRRNGWRMRVARLVMTLRYRPAPSHFLDYQTRTELHLPFEGEWFVHWGGRSMGQNRHARAVDQRFAYDFVIVRNGYSCRLEKISNEDYYCFGQPILAPADGLVREVRNDVADNQPGLMNRDAIGGNYLILEHGNDEYSFLAHLRQGSVRVEAGDRVTRGVVLGECGNSGHSTEPHLHYHLQNTSPWFNGEGLPAFFCNYLVKGERIGRGEPRGGSFVSPEGGR